MGNFFGSRSDPSPEPEYRYTPANRSPPRDEMIHQPSSNQTNNSITDNSALDDFRSVIKSIKCCTMTLDYRFLHN